MTTILTVVNRPASNVILVSEKVCQRLSFLFSFLSYLFSSSFSVFFQQWENIGLFCIDKTGLKHDVKLHSEHQLTPRTYLLKYMV